MLAILPYAIFPVLYKSSYFKSQYFLCISSFLSTVTILLPSDRFDKVIDVQMPDIAGRKAILELYAKNVRYALLVLLLYFCFTFAFTCRLC